MTVRSLTVFFDDHHVFHMEQMKNAMLENWAILHVVDDTGTTASVHMSNGCEYCAQYMGVIVDAREGSAEQASP